MGNCRHPRCCHLAVQTSPIYGTAESKKSWFAPQETGLVRKIALEEHFLCPGFEPYWNPTVADIPAAKRDQLLARLTDFGEQRLGMMDRAGISIAVLGLARPGVQAE